MRISDWSSDVCSSDLAVGRIFERAGREDDDEVEPHRVPVDLAERGDLRLDLAAQDGDGDSVADLKPHRARRLAVERDARIAVLLRRPPAHFYAPDPHRIPAGVGEAAAHAQDPATLPAPELF